MRVTVASLLVVLLRAWAAVLLTEEPRADVSSQRYQALASA